LSGSLPLWTVNGPKVIRNPWRGWTERIPGADRTLPYFAGCAAGEIFLELWTRHRPYTKREKATLPTLYSSWLGESDLLVDSYLGWPGRGAGPPAKRRWWERLTRWVKARAVRLSHGRISFWAFPSAFARLKGGMAYFARGFELDESIRTTAFPAEEARVEQGECR
jgi:hypothetical protein